MGKTIASFQVKINRQRMEELAKAYDDLMMRMTYENAHEYLLANIAWEMSTRLDKELANEKWENKTFGFSNSEILGFVLIWKDYQPNHMPYAAEIIRVIVDSSFKTHLNNKMING